MILICVLAFYVTDVLWGILYDNGLIQLAFIDTTVYFITIVDLAECFFILLDADESDGVPAISLSAGIAHGTGINDDTELFRKADEAMYEAKKNGKSSYRFA